MNIDTAGRRTELVVVAGADERDMLAEAARIVRFIDRIPESRLVDIAYTCAVRHAKFVRADDERRATGGEVRPPAAIAIVAAGTADLRARLASAAGRLESGSVRRLKDKSGTYYTREPLLSGGGRLAYIYPGATSFYPDMMRDLVVRHEECRAPFDELEAALSSEAAFRPSDFIFPPAPCYRHDADIFSSGAYAEALVSAFAGAASLTRLLDAAELRPDGIAGFGGGDIVALVRSGAAGAAVARAGRIRALGELYRLVSKSVRFGGLPRTCIFTVLFRHEADFLACAGELQTLGGRLAADLSPRMKTYVFDPSEAEAARRRLAEMGARTLDLDLDRPFNTPLCESVLPAVRKFAAAWLKSEPVCDVYSCASASLAPRKARPAREELSERWVRPVRFTETVRKMRDDGFRVFLEVGPRGLLSPAIEESLADCPDTPCVAIALDSIHRRSVLQVQHALAQLLAHGAAMKVDGFFRNRGARVLDFDAALSMEVRGDSEMRLSRAFPRLMLLGETSAAATYLQEPRGRGAKAAARAAAIAAQAGARRQFEAGLGDPLISDAPPLQAVPGVLYEFTKTFTLREAPFIGDFAYGASQLSYTDPNLRGLVMLPIPVAVEIMAETAQRVVPNRHFVRIEDFVCRRRANFHRGELTLSVHAERISPDDPRTAAVKVQIRAPGGDGDDSTKFTWPIMEANVILAAEPSAPVPVRVDPLSRPRIVHWSGRDIYPSKLGFGPRIRGIIFAETWGEGGLNYEVETPPLAGNVAFTRLPVWTVNPVLMQIVVSGFKLWRCQEKFPGAFSFPFRFRRLELRGAPPKEGSRLNCYLRLTGVTPRSHLCDIVATCGDGNVAMEIDGWEEITERVPQEFCAMVLQPATSFVSTPLSRTVLGDPATDVSSAVITDVPYPVFERNEELWLKILSAVVLNARERRELAQMKGSVARRTEWLFGRIAAKEAVRRYLRDFHQARWSYADIMVWPNEEGKPQAIGAWADNLTSRIDIAIAHTAQFVIALAAANARAGVDVESVTRNLSEEFAQGVFIPEELELAAQSANPSQTLIRFWCAKEAVSKALGTGIRFPPRELTVIDYLPDSGRIVCRLTGAWVGDNSRFKRNFTGRNLPVDSRVLRDHALAFCFIPATLFEDAGE